MFSGHRMLLWDTMRDSESWFHHQNERKGLYSKPSESDKRLKQWRVGRRNPLSNEETIFIISKLSEVCGKPKEEINSIRAVLRLEIRWIMNFDGLRGALLQSDFRLWRGRGDNFKVKNPLLMFEGWNHIDVFFLPRACIRSKQWRKILSEQVKLWKMFSSCKWNIAFRRTRAATSYVNCPPIA